MSKIDRQLFEAARSILSDCLEELDAAGGIEEYILNATPFEKSLVEQVIGLCEHITENFSDVLD